MLVRDSSLDEERRLRVGQNLHDLLTVTQHWTTLDGESERHIEHRYTWAQNYGLTPFASIRCATVRRSIKLQLSARSSRMLPGLSFGLEILLNVAKIGQPYSLEPFSNLRMMGLVTTGMDATPTKSTRRIGKNYQNRRILDSCLGHLRGLAFQEYMPADRNSCLDGARDAECHPVRDVPLAPLQQRQQGEMPLMTLLMDLETLHGSLYHDRTLSLL